MSVGATVNPSVVPALPLNLSAERAPAELRLETVVVFNGPGAWKQDAYRDEYILAVANRGETSLVVESATVTDFEGVANQAGDDPWKLENASKTWWTRVKSSPAGQYVAVGVGAIGIGGGMIVGSALASPIFAAPGAAATAVGMAGVGVIAAAPIYGVSIAVINHRNKKAATAAFQQRRLALPLTVAPGQSERGSCFFRLSPSPKTLVLHCRQNGASFDVSIDLAPLAGLHLKQESPK